MGNDGFSMDFQSFHGFFMDFRSFPCIFHGFPIVSHGFSMVFPPISIDFSMDSPRCPLIPIDFSSISDATAIGSPPTCPSPRLLAAHLGPRAERDAQLLLLHHREALLEPIPVLLPPNIDGKQ